MDATTAGVEQIEDATLETITTPTDDQVTIEINAIVNLTSLTSTSSSTPSATASTSLSSPSGIALKVHLQAPKSKRYTPAAKQRQELTATMLEAFKNESQRLAEEEDELDLSFAGYAKCMRLFLSNDQKEELNTEIGNLVANAIRNLKAGMPVIQKAPVYRQTPTSNMQNQQQAVKSHLIGDLPQPPQLQAVPHTHQGQQQQNNLPSGSAAFYIPGPTSTNYELARDLDFSTM